MTYAIQDLTPQDLPLARRIHATPWQRLIRTLRIRRQARATRHALDRLDDHMLKDIGLTRCDVWARAYHLAAEKVRAPVHRPDGAGVGPVTDRPGSGSTR